MFRFLLPFYLYHHSPLLYSMEPPSPASKNDIFTSSWRASPPPPPLPPAAALHTGLNGLGRSKTTGAAWRAKARFALEPDVHQPDFEDILTTTHASPSLPVLVIPSDRQESATTGAAQGRDSLSRTGSFFDLARRPASAAGSTATHSWYHDTPVSPALSTSTATLSHASTYSSNPSLSATLPFSTDVDGSISALSDPALDVELRFFPTPEYRLGTGRYSRVYLASYRRGRGTNANEEGPDAEGSRDRKQWELCAVKKLDDDEESQRLGLREAWFLRQLASIDRKSPSAASPHPGQVRVVRLLGMKKDEDAFHGQAAHKPRMSWPHSTLLHQALDGAKAHARHSRHSSLEEDLPPIHIPTSTSLQPHSAPASLSSNFSLVLPFAPAVLSDVIHSKPHLLNKTRHTKISLQLAQAIDFVHSQNILHTDIKPHNVLLTSTFDVLLSDFNTAIHLPSSSISVPPDDPAGLGTPVYSPPEFNKPPPSPFSYPVDIWALGVSLMVAIVGREPYARLMSGRRGKGNSRQELKMWLRKGAYWQWEDQERMDATIEDVLGTPPSAGFDSEDIGGNEKVGLEQLKKLLGDADASPDLLELSISETVPGSPDEKPREEDRYDDGSDPLRYLGGGKVSQRIYSLLRSMCSPSPASRPAIGAVVAELEQEVVGVAGA